MGQAFTLGVVEKIGGNLNAQQDSYLTEILNINKDLMTTYILGAQLKELWYCESEVQRKELTRIRGGHKYKRVGLSH
ncbi:hypothetical protein OH492_06980 [Vibrio chagasii]|nr:hypothetical protein [Vibrio chagasii]